MTNGQAMRNSGSGCAISVARFLLDVPLVVLLAAASPASLAEARPPQFPGATDEYKAWIEATLPGNPEGLALGPDGTMYAGIWETGQIVRLDGKGGSEVVATIPDPETGKAGITLGMEFGPDGVLYVAYMWHYSAAEEADPHHAACRDSRDIYTGIYAVDLHNHQAKPFLTKKDGWPGCFPDDIAFDRHGNMYVTDLTLSGIWKIAPDRTYSLWSTDPLLQWAPDPFNAAPEGANDLVITRDGSGLLVVTDGNPGVVRVPIQPDGSAGRASWVVQNLDVTDGVELDPEGNIYVSEIFREEVSVFSSDGSERIVIATPDTAPIVNPTSLVYRNGALCIANMGMGLTSKREPRSVACISGFKKPHAKSH